MGRRSPSSRRSTATCGGRPASPMSRRRCLAALASPLLWGWRSASAATARPNILFVMIDTLRADHGGILHGRTLHAEQTRGILLLRHPDRLPAGKAVTAPARHVDLTPTLLDLAGAPPDPECQGASLLPHIRGQEAEPRPCFLEGTAGTHLRAIVRGRHKLIRDLDTGAHQLYDLADDPFEKTDVAARHPDLVAALSGPLDAHIAACDAAAKRYQVGGTTPRPKLTRRDIETLRQLGYIQ